MPYLHIYNIYIMSYTPVYIYMSYVYGGQDSCHVVTNSKHNNFCSLPTHRPPANESSKCLPTFHIDCICLTFLLQLAHPPPTSTRIEFVFQTRSKYDSSKYETQCLSFLKIFNILPMCEICINVPKVSKTLKCHTYHT